MADLHIGTSGWHYDSWWGPFFPEGVRKKDALPYFASRFAATELNAPFYRTPTEKAVESWVDETPDHFRFAWKASRFITHWKRLSAKSANSIELLESRLKLLGPKAGPVLFQLPPTMKIDVPRLEDFLAMWPKRRKATFEFRHKSWFDDRIFDLLQARDIALCFSDHADAPAPWEVTASFIYIRGHGRNGRYRGSYTDATIEDWAAKIRRWHRGRREVWCFFDNDVKSAAPVDADRLIASLGRMARLPQKKRASAA
jgi:uncharacterized protein YecE (DUF72 family)